MLPQNYFYSHMLLAMEYTIREKITIIAWIISFENDSIESSRQKCTDRFNKPAPARTTLLHWSEKLLETGTLVADRPRSGRPVFASGDDASAAILADDHEDLTTSTRRLSAYHDIS